jgi:hypothetical protein
VLGLDDAVALGVQFNIVADATAKSAGRVLHHRQVHSLPRFDSPGPGGTVNVQPNARPRQLPRIRFG